MRHFLLALLLAIFSPVTLAEDPAQEPVEKPAMDNRKLQAIIEGFASDVEGRPGYWRFTAHGYTINVITDEKANRMRIIVPIVKAAEVDAARMARLLQANFDTALDARYSIARGVLWSAFIHPLSELSRRQFIDGLAQTVNLAATYGSTYSSGALVFGGGDSKGEQDKYYKAIIERENSI